jgi:hypothetical protein
MADASWFPYQSGVAQKLVPASGNTYAPAVVTSAAAFPATYDYISLAYDGSGNLTTVVYKIGGSGGTTVATATLAYTGSNLTSVTWS